MSTGREIRLTENDDGWWTATDAETGVASQGSTRKAALENLDEAVSLHSGEAGEGGESIDTPEEEREVLCELGIDPDEVEAAREKNDERPEFME